jgi:hypothetical protein
MEPWKKNLYSVWCAQFIAAVGLNMVVPFLPLYLRVAECNLHIQQKPDFNEYNC